MIFKVSTTNEDPLDPMMAHSSGTNGLLQYVLKPLLTSEPLSLGPLDSRYSLNKIVMHNYNHHL